MALYFVGLGLSDQEDISCRGLEVIKRCEYVYLDVYTSVLGSPVGELEHLYGKEIIQADRKLVEQSEEIIKKAKEHDVAFLVVGDPFGATTHIDLRLRAYKEGVKTEVVHNASIVSAVGEIGLELYKYGKVTSIPFENQSVDAPFEVLESNQKNGLHTLFLLDLEPAKNRFMTIKEALEYLLSRGLDRAQVCVGCAGIGSAEPEIKAGSARELHEAEFTKKPQCLIVPAKLHFVEEEALDMWK